MCVCVCVCVYVYIYLYIYIYMRVCVCVCVCVCLVTTEGCGEYFDFKTSQIETNQSKIQTFKVSTNKETNKMSIHITLNMVIIRW